MEASVYKLALFWGQPVQWDLDSFGNERRGTSLAYIQRWWALDVSETLRSAHIISAWKMCEHGEVRSYPKGWLQTVAFTEPGVHAEHTSTEFGFSSGTWVLPTLQQRSFCSGVTTGLWAAGLEYEQVEAPIHRSSRQQFSSNVANHVHVNRSNFPSLMQLPMQTSGRKSLHMNGISRASSNFETCEWRTQICCQLWWWTYSNGGWQSGEG